MAIVYMALRYHFLLCLDFLHYSFCHPALLHFVLPFFFTFFLSLFLPFFLFIIPSLCSSSALAVVIRTGDATLIGSMVQLTGDAAKASDADEHAEDDENDRPTSSNKGEINADQRGENSNLANKPQQQEKVKQQQKQKNETTGKPDNRSTLQKDISWW
jgi:hypothetical protein